MKHMKKVFCLFMAIAMTVSMLVGCGSSGSGEGSNDGATVKLGLIGPMTGDYANYGTSTRDGAQVAVDEINEAGGVNGCKFVLQTEDSQGDPDSAVSAFGKLMDDGMNVSLGCVLSGEAQSVITAAKNDDLLIVTCTSSAKKCIDGNDKAFRVCFNDPAQGTASANYIADNNLGKKIAVFYQSDIDYSAGLYETFTQQAAARGLFSGAADHEHMPSTALDAALVKDGAVGLLAAMVAAGLCGSNREARQLVQQGGVLVDGEKVTDPKAVLTVDALNKGVVIKKGKKVYHKVTL